MTCFSAPIDPYAFIFDENIKISKCRIGRPNLSEPYRQGLVISKAIVMHGSKVTFQAWNLNFCIVAKEGIFFFKKDADVCFFLKKN